MKRACLIILLLFLTSCSPSPELIQKAIFQTQTAAPTPTSLPINTPIPLSEINLSDFVYSPGDFPNGLELGQIQYKGELDIGVPNPINKFTQRVNKNGKDIGFVSIYLLDSLEEVETIYGETRDIDTEGSDGLIVVDDIQELGEHGFAAVVKDFVTLISFTRCNALVIMRFSTSEDTLELINYAILLDKRLEQNICR